MRLPHHLLRHSSGIYHFRLIVPSDLQAVFGLRVIKRSLRTRDPRVAARAAWEWSASYARAFATLRTCPMPDPDEVLKALRSGQTSTYVVDQEKGIFKADDAPDHARMMELLDRQERLIMVSAQAAVMRAEAVEREAVARRPDPELYAAMQRNTPPAAEDARPSPPSEFTLTLRQAIDHWDETGHVGLAGSTVKGKRLAVKEFAEFFGDQRLVRDIRRPEVSGWVRALLQNNDDTTVSTKCSHLKMFIQKARRAGHYPDGDESSNPFDKAHTVPKAEKERRHEETGWEPFTLPHLKHLFDPAKMKRSRQPHNRRAMVLGLYTGARVGEIAQLKVEHFKQDAAGFSLELQGDFKTDTSQRRIPIHPDLIRLGVLDWVAAKKQQGFDRLFPTVRLDASAGKGSAFSKGCSNQIERLELVKSVATRKLGFHSFRSTVIQELQACPKITDERRCVYVGHRFHGHERSSHKLYMRPWEPQDIESVCEGLTWGQWLDFEGLRTLLAIEDDPDHLRQARKREEEERAAQAAARDVKKARQRAAKRR